MAIPFETEEKEVLWVGCLVHVLFHKGLAYGSDSSKTELPKGKRKETKINKKKMTY